MSDLADRLRAAKYDSLMTREMAFRLFDEAADRISELEAEIIQWRDSEHDEDRRIKDLETRIAWGAAEHRNIKTELEELQSDRFWQSEGGGG